MVQLVECGHCEPEEEGGEPECKECPVCYEPLELRKMTQCMKCGNAWCATCAEQLDKCPICRNRAPSQGRKVELVAEALHSSRAYAQNAMAEWCQTGEMAAHGVPQSFTRAVAWYKKAAEQGYVDAQYNLAVCYHELGTHRAPRNLLFTGFLFAEAAKLFQKAAKKGDADAQAELGYCYASGEGVQQSNAEAFEWLQKAAAQGHTQAQQTLRDHPDSLANLLRHAPDGLQLRRRRVPAGPHPPHPHEDDRRRQAERRQDERRQVILAWGQDVPHAEGDPHS